MTKKLPLSHPEEEEGEEGTEAGEGSTERC